jgi:hypothetical protein
MMRKLIIVCSLLLAIGGVANASGTWVSGNVGNWSDTANWDSFPGTTSTATINTGTVTLDTNQTVAIALVGSAASSTGVLNIDSGANLTISKASTELLGLARATGASGTVNQSAGTVKIFNPSAATGELRLASVAGATGTYNLSGTGILDVQVLSKGAIDRTGYFNATGGTLVVRTAITKFGVISAGYGFNQGLCTMAAGGISTVGAITVGASNSLLDYTVGAGGTLAIDIASAASFDVITQYGNVCNIDGATLSVNLLGGFTPTVNSFFDVWTFGDKSKAGSGAFATLPAGFSSAWVDTNADLSTDTLRLTYVPEPTTLFLLGLGGLMSLKKRRS